MGELTSTRLKRLLALAEIASSHFASTMYGLSLLQRTQGARERVVAKRALGLFAELPEVLRELIAELEAEGY